MGKGNGTSRASSSSAPKGLTASQQNIANVNNAVLSQNNSLSTSAKSANRVEIKMQRGDTREDFDRYSGIKTEDAVSFVNAVNRETGGAIKSATLFYSGYAGFSLGKDGYLMYDGNAYGLEDAKQGRGWTYRGSNQTIRDAVSKLSSRFNKPGKVRM